MPKENSIDQVMQAAEAAQRILSGTTYGGETGDILYDQDATTVAECLVSILPKGKRPVPITMLSHEQSVWTLDENNVVMDMQVRHFLGRGEPYYLVMDEDSDIRMELWMFTGVYSTEAEANLALQWQKFDAAASA